MTIDSTTSHAPSGTLRWLGVRPAKAAPMIMVTCAQIKIGLGLVGDRYSSANGKRQLTLFQWEHLANIAVKLEMAKICPSALRRNLGVSGINLLSLRGQQFYVGAVLLEYTGLCLPCLTMENTLGPGGYSAMIGCGGITARVIGEGILRVGDRLNLSAPQ